MIEEIETLGCSDYNAVLSLLMRQIEHRLKIDYANHLECDRYYKIGNTRFSKKSQTTDTPSEFQLLLYSSSTSLNRFSPLCF